MKILRLFITNDLSLPINWQLVSSDHSFESGINSYEEIMEFDKTDLNLAVYLDSKCTTIFKANTTHIANKKITSELVLGLIEEELADEIEDVHPVVLDTIESDLFIAVFNKQFYNSLIENINKLNIPLIVMQSFVFTTYYNESEWTLYVDEYQQFLRTSKYQYYLLDNMEPIPVLLGNLLDSMDTIKLNVYTNQKQLITYIKENYKNIQVKIMDSNLNFDNIIWNFYNQKSLSFRFKLSESSKKELSLLKDRVLKFIYLLFFLWICAITIDEYNIIKIQTEMKNKFEKYIKVDKKIDENFINEAHKKIIQLKHDRGLYDQSDVMPLFQDFLIIFSDVKSNSVLKIDYKNGKLDIFLNNTFKLDQFNNYANIFVTKGIKASYVSYKNYSKNNKVKSGIGTDSADILNPDVAYVVTLFYIH